MDKKGFLERKAAPAYSPHPAQGTPSIREIQSGFWDVRFETGGGKRAFLMDGEFTVGTVLIQMPTPIP
jgi:hypothetical protein